MSGKPLFERSTAVLAATRKRVGPGLPIIGAGGVGQVLLDSINGFQYDQTGCIVLVIVVAVSLIDLLSQIIRTRLL